MFSFTPTSSADYDIFTSLVSGNPYLILFDSSGEMLAYNDDGNGNMNAIVNCYLTAGTTYFIAAQGYNGNAAVFNIKAVKGNLIIYLNTAIEAVVPNAPVTYEFVAPYTADYNIYTEFPTTRNEGYPSLALYDDNRCLIEYNTLGRGVASHAAIVSRLNAGQKYYIEARNTAHDFMVYTLIIMLY